MRRKLLKMLLCPHCRKGKFSLINSKQKDGNIESGTLKCDICNRKYTITDSTPILIDAEDTASPLRRKSNDFKKKTKIFFEKNPSPRYGEESFITKEINCFAKKHHKNSVFLDFDGGDGQTTEKLRLNTIIHVDNAQKAYHNNAISIISDGENLPLADKSIDCGIAINVFHHTEGWKGIREISRVLKPGSQFLFIDKTGDNPIANACYKMFRFMPLKIKKSIEDNDLTIDGNPAKIRMFKHNTMKKSCISNGLIPLREERSKILKWFIYYLEKFLPFSFMTFFDRLEIVLMKTPANAFCFTTIMEVKKRTIWVGETQKSQKLSNITS